MSNYLSALNEFLATTVVNMTDKERDSWNSLSEFERKTIAAAAFFFAKSNKEVHRSANLSRIAYDNVVNA